MDIVVKQCIKVSFGQICSIWVCAKWVPKLWMLSEKRKNFEKKSGPNQSEPNQSKPNQSKQAKSEQPKFPQITMSSMELFLLRRLQMFLHFVHFSRSRSAGVQIYK